MKLERAGFPTRAAPVLYPIGPYDKTQADLSVRQRVSNLCGHNGTEMES